MHKKALATMFLPLLTVAMALDMTPVTVAFAAHSGGHQAKVTKAQTKGAVGDRKHHWLFPNHPRLRRITKAAGFGVVTGGLAAPLLGMSVVGGAAAGQPNTAQSEASKTSTTRRKKGSWTNISGDHRHMAKTLVGWGMPVACRSRKAPYR